eukprot:364818-Chlamydomonas_euryale.AAC.16
MRAWGTAFRRPSLHVLDSSRPRSGLRACHCDDVTDPPASAIPHPSSAVRPGPLVRCNIARQPYILLRLLWESFRWAHSI